MSRTDRPTGAAALARASWVVWRRQTASSLGTRPGVVDAALAIGLVLCGALAVLVSTLIIGTFAAAGRLPGEVDLLPFARITAAGALLGGALPPLLLAATRSRSTALGDLAAVLPIGVGARTAAERMPTALLGLVFAIVLTAPLGAFLLTLLADDPARAAGALGVHLVLIAVTAAGCPAMFELLYGLACRARMPHGYAAALAVGALLAAVVAVSAPALVPRPDLGVPVPLTPVEAAAQLSVTAGGVRVLVAGAVFAGWVVAAAVLSAIALRHPVRTPAAEFTRIFAGVAIPRGRGGAGVALHALQLVRLPQFLIMGGGSVALALALASPAARALPALTEPLAALPLVAPFAIAMFAFGLTHGSSWWVRTTAADGRRTAVERLAAAGLVGAVPALLAGAVLVATGTVPVPTAIEQFAAGLVLWLAASLGGVLVPWSRQSPLATTLTSAVSFALYALAVAPLQLAVDGWTAPAPQLALGASAAVLGSVWIVVARRRRTDDLVIP